jgi:hypothetical protein
MKVYDKNYEGLNFQRVEIVFTGFADALSGKHIQLAFLLSVCHVLHIPKLRLTGK